MLDAIIWALLSSYMTEGMSSDSDPRTPGEREASGLRQGEMVSKPDFGKGLNLTAMAEKAERDRMMQEQTMQKQATQDRMTQNQAAMSIGQGMPRQQNQVGYNYQDKPLIDLASKQMQEATGENLDFSKLIPLIASFFKKKSSGLGRGGVFDGDLSASTGPDSSLTTYFPSR